MRPAFCARKIADQFFQELLAILFILEALHPIIVPKNFIYSVSIFPHFLLAPTRVCAPYNDVRLAKLYNNYDV